MTDPTHIVVVDDEPDIRDTLCEYLSLKGFRVSVADCGEALRKIVDDDNQNIDLVILDINMPGEDGLSLARYLRANFSLCIIMLTAAGEVVDRIIGLEMGADDYLPKPVDMRELLARSKAVLRRYRTGGATSVVTSKTSERIWFGRCVLDFKAHKLFDENGTEVSITAMEFDLLQVFSASPNRVLSRDQILEMAHNREWDPYDRSIDIRIARIRRKIEQDPSKPQIIKTVRGIGYMFVPDGI